jgi:CRISPR-associated protein Csx17
MNKPMLKTKQTSWVAGGCTLEPLGNYLKALGLLQILGDDGKGHWQEGNFVLETRLTPEQVIDHLTETVNFFPIVTPWNGTNGLWKQDAGSKLIAQIGDSSRLAELKEVLADAKAIVKEYGSDKQPSRKEKPAFIETCLGRIKNENWQAWAKACLTLVTDDKGNLDFVFSYLLGTGGNIGVRDLGANYLQALSYLIDLQSGDPTAQAKTFWRSSVFGESLRNTVVPEALGAQFFPAADYVFDSKKYPYEASGGGSTATANPSDVILMTEGLLAFSIIAKRELEQDEQDIAEYSLAVNLCAGTADTAVPGEARGNIEEFWLPIWNKPLSFESLRESLFKCLRGRLPQKGQPDSLDFAEYIASEAMTRNIFEFQRVGFFTRKGQSNFAVSLGIFRPRVSGDLGPELTGYRKRLASLSKGKTATQPLIALTHQMESELMAFSKGHGAIIPILKTLGQLELYLARSPSFQGQIQPLPELKVDWILEALEELSSSVVRLALSLSSLWLRGRLSPALPGQKGWFWADRSVKWGPDLLTNLIELQRSWVHEERPYPDVPISPTFSDVAAFLNGFVDLKELEILAAGFSLCKTPQVSFEGTVSHQIQLPALYQLSAFCQWSGFGSIEIVNALSSEDLTKARDLCYRKLLSHKVSPFPIPLSSQSARRIAAAVVFPLAPSQIIAIETYFLENKSWTA